MLCVIMLSVIMLTAAFAERHFGCFAEYYYAERLSDVMLSIVFFIAMLSVVMLNTAYAEHHFGCPAVYYYAGC
jgi:hypothetical protein